MCFERGVLSSFLPGTDEKRSVMLHNQHTYTRCKTHCACDEFKTAALESELKISTYSAELENHELDENVEKIKRIRSTSKRKTSILTRSHFP